MYARVVYEDERNFLEESGREVGGGGYKNKITRSSTGPFKFRPWLEVPSLPIVWPT